MMKNYILKFQNIINKIKQKLLPIDQKINKLIPNPKIKKFAYIGVLSILVFFVFIFILAAVVTSSKKTTQDNTTIRPVIKVINSTSEPKKNRTPNQIEINNIESEIKNLILPPSILNKPVIETDLKI